MTGLLPAESSHHGSSESGPSSRNSLDKPEEVGRWYFSRREIEDNSPSRRDGIDLKKETYLRKSYCTFLQDLGMRLKVPQVTIATAIIFCHRFFIRQSHAKNDRREIYEQQKELILIGERVVLATLGFDLNVHHPYKPLVEAIKKFKVAQNALAQVAWNFVNDGLRTSLCLQFKPHHIAAGAIFLAAKFLKVKLPSDGEKVWWQEFDVTPRQLEEVSNQMLELYEQNRVPQSQGSEVEQSSGGVSSHRASAKPATAVEEQASKQVPSRPSTEHSYSNNPARTAKNNENNDDGSGEMDSVITDHKVDTESKESYYPEQLREVPKKSKSGGRNDVAEAGEWRDDGTSRSKSSNIVGNVDLREGPVSQSPKEAIKLDRDKLKAQMEKRKKARGEMTRKKDVMDEDDLIERELEDGIELAVEDEKFRREQRQPNEKLDNGEVREAINLGTKGQSLRGLETENAEEGEMVNNASPVMNGRKRRDVSPVDRQSDGKKRHDYKLSSYNHDNLEDGMNRSRASHPDREYKRHEQENI